MIVSPRTKVLLSKNGKTISGVVKTACFDKRGGIIRVDIGNDVILDVANDDNINVKIIIDKEEKK